jgi:hypothetical protein
MTNYSTDISPRKAALVAGVAYLIVFFLTPHAWISKLIVSGDAVTTFQNITSNELLFRAGTACWFIVLVADAVVAWALYCFFLPVSKSLSLLAAWFRLLFVAVMGLTALNLLNVLQLIEGADYFAAYDIGQLHAQLMLFLNAYDYGSNIAFVFFGFHIGVLSYLVLKSDFVPRVLAALLLVAFAGYQIDSFSSFLSASYVKSPLGFILTVAIPAVIAEFSLTVWLLFKGGKAQRTQ